MDGGLEIMAKVVGGSSATWDTSTWVMSNDVWVLEAVVEASADGNLELVSGTIEDGGDNRLEVVYNEVGKSVDGVSGGGFV